MQLRRLIVWALVGCVCGLALLFAITKIAVLGG